MIGGGWDLRLPFTVLLVAAIVVFAAALVRVERSERARRADKVLDFGSVRHQVKS